MAEQTDVMIGDVRVTISENGLVVGLIRGDDHIEMTENEARDLAALVTLKLGTHTVTDAARPQDIP
jgi:hypothetical protein